MRVEMLKRVPTKLVGKIVQGFRNDGAVRIIVDKEDAAYETVTAEFSDRKDSPRQS